MEVTIIAETTGDALHPVTAQLVGAACSMGGAPTVICPGGIGTSEASTISGVVKVISAEGDCFGTFDSGAWADALSPLCEGVVMTSSSAHGREVLAQIAAIRDIPIVQDATGLESGIKVTRPIYSGKAIETSVVSPPCAISIRQNAFESPGSDGSSDISTVNNSSDIGVAVKEALAKASD